MDKVSKRDKALSFSGADLREKLTRNIAVDGLRGLLLVIIAINHLESPLLTPYTRESLGFVSAAEAFILLSGIVSALVYGRYLDDTRRLMQKIYRRVLTIYFYVIAGTLTITALLHMGWLPDVWYYDWGNYFLLENYLNYPAQSLFLSSIQLQQIGYLDILIAYMLPMLLLPWALVALHRGRWFWVMGASVSVWLIAQFSSDQILAPIYYWLEPVLKIDAGYLDVLAWQLLFFSGVCLGFYANNIGSTEDSNKASSQQSAWLDSPRLLILAMVAACTLFMVKQLGWTELITSNFWRHLFNWQDLGLVRYVNTLVLAYLLTFLVRRRFWLFCLNPLIFLGQHSLPVFCFHAVAIYFFLPWMMAMQESYSWYWDLSIVSLFVASLFLPARLHSKFKHKR